MNREFFTYVFSWMGTGLAVTASTSWYIFYQQPQILDYLLRSPLVLFALLIAQLALVFWLSSSVRTMSFSTGLSVFLLYAFLNGITISGILFTYTQESIALTFGITAILFFATALFGYLTRIDLTPFGVLGFMVLIGLIIAICANLFFQSSRLDMIISAIGVVLFSALTAYDMQQLQMFATQVHNGREQDYMYQVALLGALQLYLDFINVFLMVLSFTGKRRD